MIQFREIFFLILIFTQIHSARGNVWDVWQIKLLKEENRKMLLKWDLRSLASLWVVHGNKFLKTHDAFKRGCHQLHMRKFRHVYKWLQLLTFFVIRTQTRSKKFIKRIYDAIIKAKRKEFLTNLKARARWKKKPETIRSVIPVLLATFFPFRKFHKP